MPTDPIAQANGRSQGQPPKGPKTMDYSISIQFPQVRLLRWSLGVCGLVFLIPMSVSAQATVPAKTLSTNSIGMKLMLSPPGERMMGSPSHDTHQNGFGSPQRPARMTQPLYMGKHEVTKGQFAAFIRAT